MYVCTYVCMCVYVCLGLSMCVYVYNRWGYYTHVSGHIQHILQAWHVNNQQTHAMEVTIHGQNRDRYGNRTFLTLGTIHIHILKWDYHPSTDQKKCWPLYCHVGFPGPSHPQFSLWRTVTPTAMFELLAGPSMYPSKWTCHICVDNILTSFFTNKRCDMFIWMWLYTIGNHLSYPLFSLKP
jgi:hypothetical protein